MIKINEVIVLYYSLSSPSNDSFTFIIVHNFTSGIGPYEMIKTSNYFERNKNFTIRKTADHHLC